jgi:hypothetical protein
MGCLIAAAQSRSNDELTNALARVRVLGAVRRSGTWSWTFVFYLHFKELHEALSTYQESSLSAYAGDGAWKLSLFGPKQPPFSLWFDASLASQRGIEKAKTFYSGKALKLARQFGLSDEERGGLGQLPFEEAVSRLLDIQLRGLLDAFQRFSILHDPIAIRDILLNPTPEELDSELGNLPRFLKAVGLRGLFED